MKRAYLNHKKAGYLTIERMGPLFIIWGSGLFISCIAMLCEIVLYKFIGDQQATTVQRQQQKGKYKLRSRNLEVPYTTQQFHLPEHQRPIRVYTYFD